MSDIEYSVITSDVIKSFDCISNESVYIKLHEHFGMSKVAKGGVRSRSNFWKCTIPIQKTFTPVL